MREEKYTIENVKKTILKLKRRKEIKEGRKRINIGMIAKELGCAREYLYASKFEKTIAPYKVQKHKEGVCVSLDSNEQKKKAVKFGTLEYYKMQLENRNKEVENLSDKLIKSLKAQADGITYKEKTKELELKLKSEKERYGRVELSLKKQIAELQKKVEWYEDLDVRKKANL